MTERAWERLRKLETERARDSDNEWGQSERMRARREWEKIDWESKGDIARDWNMN